MTTEKQPSSTASEQADVIVRNGRIATQDEHRSFASAVASKDCRFLWVLVVVTLLASAPLTHAQTTRLPSPPPYQLLRFEEDYRYLRDPGRPSDLWDPLKCIALNDAATWYLSLGGEVRERYEYFHNTNWGQGPQDEDGYVLQRYMLHADLHLGEALRVFGQLKSGLENERSGGPRPTDEDKLDLHQAFLDVTLAATTSTTLVFRGGRQELLFGTQRLVSVREGPNVRQSLDGGRLIGTRLWGRPQPWDYNFEFVYQWGDFGRGAIQAWTAASETGYTLQAVRFHPRLGLKADIASGDHNPRDRTLQTFNALFPKGAYFGEIALIGPANFFDLHPLIDFHLTKSVTLTTDWDFFWRQNTHDGIY